MRQALKQKWIRALAVSGLILLCGAYFPSLLYAFHKIGITEARNRTLVFAMDDGWFPLLYSESRLGRLLGKSWKYPTLVLVKVRWYLPSIQKLLIVSVDEAMVDPRSSNGNVLDGPVHYSWGDAYFFAKSSEIERNGAAASSQISAFAPEFRAVLTSPDRSTLNEIRNIAHTE